MNVNKESIGAVGIIHVLRDANARFKKASESWPEGVVPTISESDLVYEPCPHCRGRGRRDSSYVPKGGMAPLWCEQECDKCGGTGKLGHPFPKKIAELAKLLARQDELEVARTLAGLCLGFKP